VSRDNSYKPKDSSIVTVPVSQDLHRRIRVHCAEQGRTVKWLMTKAIEEYLERQKP
jgi:predicted transcriptional regulator